ncbi:MAG: ribonuclease HII [Bacteroidetes bacterium]|jgi:ribonuclease HII|nr:ribonuclease HII [Bacteroidota bacterium]
MGVEAANYRANTLLPYCEFDGWEVGCDEAGRGCLAGPVVAAAARLPKGVSLDYLNDSKKLSAKQRDMAKHRMDTDLHAYAVAEVSPGRIDEINILQASIEAMHRALDKMGEGFSLILVDGNKFRHYKNLEHRCMIKGDGRYQSIAAASILAKTYRDALMLKYHEEWPMYGWDRNMGYPTAHHVKALLQYGPCPLHRKSFKVQRHVQLPLFLS